MAKAVGLDAGEYEIKLVELDGSYRKTRLTKIIVERVEQDDSGADDALHASRGAMSALSAFKEVHASRENVTLGFPSREAVFRRLMVPFSGRDQIRKVIKFEVEGSIHSHSVDDMVVDFHTVDEDKGESQVMVAAVPKSGLQVTLHALERVGIEPETVDLDAMALYRVADWCGAFSEEEPSDGEEVPEEPSDEDDVENAVVPLVDRDQASEDPVRVVLDIGARSTRVLLVVKGQLVDMRTLRSGEASLVEELSNSGGLSAVEARRALGYRVEREEADEGGDGDEGEDGEDEEIADDFVIRDDDDEEDEDPTDAVNPEVLVGEARGHFLDRLRRELIRFLTSVKHTGPVEAVWVTGGGALLPGLDAMLAEVFGCAPRRLRVLDRLSHGLDEEEAQDLEPRIAVAVGLALGPLGGPTGFNFRQEELVFTRGFDRIKFPLAIACMVALFLVVVFAVKSWRDLQWLELHYGQTFSDGEERTGPNLLFQGYVAYLLNRSNSWFARTRNFDSREYRNLMDAVNANPVFGISPEPSRLDVIRSRLASYLTSEREKTGIYNDLALESGFAVLVRWAEVLEGVEEQLGRYLIMDLELSLPTNARSRWLRFNIALRDDGLDFRSKHAELVRAFEEECQRPDSPFSEIGDEGREIVFVDSDDSGSYYTMQINVRPTFEAFVPARGGGE